MLSWTMLCSCDTARVWRARVWRVRAIKSLRSRVLDALDDHVISLDYHRTTAPPHPPPNPTYSTPAPLPSLAQRGGSPAVAVLPRCRDCSCLVLPRPALSRRNGGAVPLPRQRRLAVHRRPGPAPCTVSLTCHGPAALAGRPFQPPPTRQRASRCAYYRPLGGMNMSAAGEHASGATR